MSAPNQNSIALLLMDRVFAGIVKLWPADRRDWAHAMHAEFQQMNTAGEKLSWLLGGAMSLTSAWTQRLFWGSRKAPELAMPRAVKKPGALAFVLMAIALASLALPGMWRGVLNVTRAWVPSRVGLSEQQLEVMGVEAERRGDARTMAFVSTCFSNSQKSAHYADAAVALDPKLTWIYFETNGSTYVMHPQPQEILRRARLLETWDPTNAVPYLMEADVAFSQFRIVSGNPQWIISSKSWDEAAERLGKNDQWAKPMAAAFSAAKYDNYVHRYYDLVLTVMRENRLSEGIDLANATLRVHGPDLLMMQVYTAGLLNQGARYESNRDFSNAAKNYWQVARAAELMAIGSTKNSFSYTTAIAMKERAFQSLQLLASNAGASDQAAFAGYQVSEIETERAAILDSYSHDWPYFRKLRLTDIAIHVSVWLGLAAALLACPAMAAFGLGFGSSARFGRLVCKLARIAPATLFLCASIFYACYFPYIDSLRGATHQNLQRAVWNYQAMLYTPQSIIPFGQRGFYLWGVFLAVCCFSVLTFATRVVLRGWSDRAAA